MYGGWVVSVTGVVLLYVRLRHTNLANVCPTSSSHESLNVFEEEGFSMHAFSTNSKRVLAHLNPALDNA